MSQKLLEVSVKLNVNVCEMKACMWDRRCHNISTFLHEVKNNIDVQSRTVVYLFLDSILFILGQNVFKTIIIYLDIL